MAKKPKDTKKDDKKGFVPFFMRKDKDKKPKAKKKKK